MYPLNAITIRTVNFNTQISALLYYLFSTARCSTLALRNKNGDNSSSVGPYNCHCQVKLLQNNITMFTAQRDVTKGGVSSGAAAKGAGKSNFKVKGKS